MPRYNVVDAQGVEINVKNDVGTVFSDHDTGIVVGIDYEEGQIFVKVYWPNYIKQEKMSNLQNFKCKPTSRVDSFCCEELILI